MHTTTMNGHAPAAEAPARPSAQICGDRRPDPHPDAGPPGQVKADFTDVTRTVPCRVCFGPIRARLHRGDLVPVAKTGLCRDCWQNSDNWNGDRRKQEPAKAIPAAQRIIKKSVSRARNPGDSLLVMMEFHAWLGDQIRETGRSLTAALGPEQVAADLTHASGQVWTRQRVWERWGGARDQEARHA